MPSWVPWVCGIVALAATEPIIHQAAILFGAAAFAAPIMYIRSRFPARDDAERAEQKFLDQAYYLRAHASDGSLRKRFPPQVLAALERVAAARVAALAKIAMDHSTLADHERTEIDRRMMGALMTAMPLFRTDKQSKREWESISANPALIGPVLNAIELQELRMSDPSAHLDERLAALRELSEVTAVDLKDLA